MLSQIADALGIKIDLYFGIITWGLLFTRIFVMILLTPFLGGRGVPNRVRVLVSIVLSLFLAPLMIPQLEGSFPTNKGILLALFFKEIFFAMTIGLVTLFVFFSLEAAGRMVDHQRGGGNAEIFVPALGQVSIFGVYTFWLSIALFISVGGHRFFLQAFFDSFESVPLLSFPPLKEGFSPFLQYIVRLSSDVLVIAVQIAAPVLIAVLLVDLVLGLANKMAPQINVFELGFALRGYLAPLMLYVSVLVLVSKIEEIGKGMVASVYRLTELFAQ